MWLMQAPATCTITVHLNICISNHNFAKIDVRSLYHCIMRDFYCPGFLKKSVYHQEMSNVYFWFFLKSKTGILKSSCLSHPLYLMRGNLNRMLWC